MTRQDANRQLAIEMMGVRCVLLTSEQLHDVNRYHVFVRHLADLLERPYRDKTARQLKAEREMRRYLFGDWESLGMARA